MEQNSHQTSVPKKCPNNNTMIDKVIRWNYFDWLVWPIKKSVYKKTLNSNSPQADIYKAVLHDITNEFPRLCCIIFHVKNAFCKVNVSLQNQKKKEHYYSNLLYSKKSHLILSYHSKNSSGQNINTFSTRVSGQFNPN